MPHRDAGALDSERLARLVAVSRRLATDSDLRPALRFLLESAIALTGAERGFLLFKRGNLLSCEATVPDLPDVPGPVPAHLSRSVLARVFKGDPVLSTDLAADDRFRGRVSVQKLGLRSVLAVPLPCRAGAAGYLYLDSRVSRAFFRSEDLELLVAFAAQGALALENASLARQVTAAGSLGSGVGQPGRQDARDGQSLPGDTGTAEGTRVGTAPEGRAGGGHEPSRGGEGPGRSSVRDGRRQSTHAASAATRHTSHGEGRIIGSSPGMRRALDLVAKVAPSGLAVLIVGESGTGKELIARAIHRESARSAARFVAENCAAIPETLIESELFGAVRGAFTGAERDREGLFRAADGGTLFLDEIAEMPIALQARLLRALQEGEVRPVGSHRAVRVDVRIVAATNRDPGAAIASRRLRLDLYYRLAGITVEIPPLRERREDIPLLAAHFLERSAEMRGTAALRLSPEALLRLAAHEWPGNVRELENEIERAAVLARGLTIEPEDLSTRIGGGASPPPSRFVQTAERSMIEAALVGQRGSVTGAANAIGWSRQKLYRRMLLLGVPKRFGRGPVT